MATRGLPGAGTCALLALVACQQSVATKPDSGGTDVDAGTDAGCVIDAHGGSPDYKGPPLGAYFFPRCTPLQTHHHPHSTPRPHGPRPQPLLPRFHASSRAL